MVLENRKKSRENAMIFFYAKGKKDRNCKGIETYFQIKYHKSNIKSPNAILVFAVLLTWMQGRKENMPGNNLSRWTNQREAHTLRNRKLSNSPNKWHETRQ